MKEEFPKDDFGVITKNENHIEIVRFLNKKGFDITNLFGGKCDNNFYCVPKGSDIVKYCYKNLTSKTYTLEQLKALDMNEKKIIGYKLIKPEYLEAANEICKKLNTGTSIGEFSFLRIGINRLSIPALKDAGVLDIWFEPVYEPEKPKEKVITVNGTKISIKQGSIYAVDRTFKIESIKHLIGLMSSNYNKDFWDTKFTEVKIGCKTGWTKAHLEEIIREYQEFNK